MAEPNFINNHPERLPGTWCVVLAKDNDCRLAFNLPNKAAAEAARSELAPRYPGQRLEIGFFPTREQITRWKAHEPTRVETGSTVQYHRLGPNPIPTGHREDKPMQRIGNQVRFIAAVAMGNFATTC